MFACILCLSDIANVQMEGQSRPTFFRGVATVVTKLFNIVQPDYAYFGQKDIQQCLILRRLIADLHMPHPPSPLHMRIVPTVRDFDNVALSSRNAYLSPAERQYAPSLFAALSAAERAILESAEAGEASIHSAKVLEAGTIGLGDFVAAMQAPSAHQVDIELDYIKINNPMSLSPLAEVGKGQPAVLSGAVRIGKTRLIDNFLVNIVL
jgi:pantoate--beta-alanine ligase